MPSAQICWYKFLDKYKYKKYASTNTTMQAQIHKYTPGWDGRQTSSYLVGNRGAAQALEADQGNLDPTGIWNFDFFSLFLIFYEIVYSIIISNGKTRVKI